MPETGETHILVFSEVAFDFLALCGGFYDDEGATGGGAMGSGSGTGARGCGARARGCGRFDFELGRHCVCCSKIYNIRIQFYTCLYVIF
jgi:hypothetical protein